MNVEATPSPTMNPYQRGLIMRSNDTFNEGELSLIDYQLIIWSIANIPNSLFRGLETCILSEFLSS